MCSIKLALPPEEEIDLFIGFFPVAYNSKSNKRQLVSLNEQWGLLTLSLGTFHVHTFKAFSLPVLSFHQAYGLPLSCLILNWGSINSLGAIAPLILLCLLCLSLWCQGSQCLKRYNGRSWPQANGIGFSKEPIAREACCIHSTKGLSPCLHMFVVPILWPQREGPAALLTKQVNWTKVTVPCLLHLSGMEEIWQVGLYLYRKKYFATE